MESYVRFDALESVFIARAYDVPIDPTRPLKEMTIPYAAVAVVVVAGDSAFVQALHGVVLRRVRKEFMRELARMGVSRVIWRRQRDSRIEEKSEILNG